MNLSQARDWLVRREKHPAPTSRFTEPGRVYWKWSLPHARASDLPNELPEMVFRRLLKGLPRCPWLYPSHDAAMWAADAAVVAAVAAGWMPPRETGIDAETVRLIEGCEG